jgi:hypothetical protein
LRKLERETNDEQTRIAVRDFFKYSRISGWIVVGGLILMLLIGFLNAWQNGTGN